MHQAVEYLHRLGHRRIALSEFGHSGLGLDKMAWIGARNRSFLEACQQYGIEAGDENMLIDNALVDTEDKQIEAGKHVIANLSRSKAPYSAIIGINDYVALGMLREVRKRRLSYSIIGFDNIPQAGTENLTTLGVPSAEIGMVAVDMLEDMLVRPRRREGVYQQVVVRPNLICRESVRPIVR